PPVRAAEGDPPARDVPDELLLHGAADDSRERDLALVHDDPDRGVDPARVLDEALVAGDPPHQFASQPVVEARDALDADLALHALEAGDGGHAALDVGLAVGLVHGAAQDHDSALDARFDAVVHGVPGVAQDLVDDVRADLGV